MAADRTNLQKELTGLTASSTAWTNANTARTEVELAVSTRAYHGAAAANLAAANVRNFVTTIGSAEWSDNVVVTAFSFVPAVATTQSGTNYNVFTLQYADTDGTNITNVNIPAINTANVASQNAWGVYTGNVANVAEIPAGKHVLVLSNVTGTGAATTPTGVYRLVVKGK
jgi:hypothetical protein